MPVNVNGVTLGNTFSAGSYEVPSMVVFVHTRAVLSAKRDPFLWGLSTVDGLYPTPFIHPYKPEDTDACKYTHSHTYTHIDMNIRLLSCVKDATPGISLTSDTILFTSLSQLEYWMLDGMLLSELKSPECFLGVSVPCWALEISKLSIIY